MLILMSIVDASLSTTSSVYNLDYRKGFDIATLLKWGDTSNDSRDITLEFYMKTPV